jgi:hypothetical protein
MLRFALFKDFKSGPKILFWGGPEDVSELSKILREFSAGESKFNLNEDRRFLSVDGSQIILEMGSRTMGMQRESNTDSRRKWVLDPEGVEEIAEKLDALSKVKAGHQYLEAWAGSEIPLMVSIGEYPEDLVP